MLLLAPVMAAVAIAVKFDSRGPVLFRQMRYGFNIELIEVFKFRSMYTDMCDAAASKPVTKEDPRVTPVGRFIRKTSIDELPQCARVGTSSLRRQCQLRTLRPDLQIFDLRGNVNTRLKKLDDGEYDAIMLAAAGVNSIAVSVDAFHQEYIDMGAVERNVLRVPLALLVLRPVKGCGMSSPVSDSRSGSSNWSP